MTWGWPRCLGVIIAGLCGSAIFAIAARIVGDTSLLINSDVIGAAIGASLTIAGTLAIDAGRRRSEKQVRLHQLRRSLEALKTIAEKANAEVDLTLPIHDRAINAAAFLGALGGGRETLLYARSRVDIEDIGLWLRLETLDRAFTRFDKQREADKITLSQPDITELDLSNARHRMGTFNNEVVERLDQIIAMIDKVA